SFIIQAQLDPAFWQNPMPFPDVERTAYYAQAVRDLAIAGTLEGYEDGTFKPDRPINRAEFFKMALFEFLSKDKITLEEYDKFTDLSEKDWHFQYMELAKQLGVIEPDKEGRFFPNQTISRMEALTMILKIYDIETEKPAEEPQDSEEGETEDGPQENLEPVPFTDIPADYPSVTAIRAGIEHGLLGQLGTAFKPSQPVTRAEVAYWVWKLKFDYL
ncbi:S-layer homology domain-containing protein, partial [Candidatus Peregrinibacteria bacterium]|nr:S-layer homology domain-containing protein [Candidatus Peregrinibacteria bacterium]